MDLTLLNALAPALAALALGSLGLVSMASGRLRRVWRPFAVFCFLLMGAALSAALAVHLEAWLPSVVAVRLIPSFALCSVVAALVYVAELEQLSVSGRWGRFEFGYRWRASGPEITLLGRRASFRRYLGALLGGCSLLVGLMVGTPWVLASAAVSPENELVVEPGPLFPVAVVLGLFMLSKVDYFLLRGWLGMPRGARRNYVAWSFLGFNVAYTPALLSNLAAFWLGRPVQPAVFSCFPLAVLVFYVAIVRYQFAQIDELNRSLEGKVRARTRQLEQAQTRLVQSEKMASLGRLVAGVAHEINSPLGALSSMQQSLDRSTEKMRELLPQLDKDTPDRQSRLTQLGRLLDASSEACRVMADGTERVGGVVARLKRFARLDESAFQQVDVHSGISDTLELVVGGSDAGLSVQTEFGQLPSLHCDPRALNQLWLNLLLNARDALPGGRGRVEIRTHESDQAVVVCVRDTGSGIAPEHRSRIFDPGFTTKGVGVGTGLGLAICYQIVEDHGGSIEVHSELGVGTRVEVRLPTSSLDASPDHHESHASHGEGSPAVPASS